MSYDWHAWLEKEIRWQPENPALPFVLEYGRSCSGLNRIKVKLGREKRCFCNAAGLAMDDDDIVYVEGFCNTGTFRTFPHAWCMRGDQLLDPTLRTKEPADYFGVAIPTKLLIKIITKQEYYGILTGELFGEFARHYEMMHASKH